MRLSGGPYVNCVGSFGTFLDFKFNFITGSESFVAIHFYRGVMSEKVLASIFRQDETVAFGIVEPLNFTQSHSRSSPSWE